MRVLLITDTERLQLIFAALESKGLLELRTAATLTPSDLEISASAPDFTFVQSRISGFSSVILLRHLKKVLPPKAKIILMAGDADDAAQARQGAIPFLDLSADDEALEEAIKQLLENKTPAAPKKRATGQAISAGKGAEAKVKKPAAQPFPVLEGVEGKQKTARKPVAKEPIQPASAPLPPANLASSGIEEPVAQEPAAASPPAQRFEELVFPTLSTGESAALPAPEGKKPADEEPPAHSSGQQQGVALNEAQKRSIKSFEAVLGRASGKGVSATEPMDVEDRVDLGPQSSEAEPTDEWGIASVAPELEQETGRSASDNYYGEPLADAIRRAEKKNHPRWIIPVAVALLVIALALYLAVGKKKAAPDSLATSQSVTQLEQRPAEGAPPTTTAPPPPLTAPAQAPAAPGSVATPTAKRGLKELPPFLSGTKPDPEYGKTHPGWQRYIGKQAEYKVFQEAGIYRAIQVIALGGKPLSDQLFSRVLLEFGGIDSYQVQSSDKKGSYFQEEGVAKGGVAVTIYRNKSDRKVKGMVVYYR
jgi:hypothetical protein